MKVNMMSRVEAFCQAGQLVMKNLIADDVITFEVFGEHPSLKTRSSTKRTRVINHVQVLLAGSSAVWLCVEDPSEGLLEDVSQAVGALLDELTEDELIRQQLYVQAEQSVRATLGMYRHVVEAVANALMSPGDRTGKPKHALIRAAIEEMEQHLSISLAGKAVAVRVLGGQVGEISAYSQHPEQGAGYISVRFHKSDELRRAIRAMEHRVSTRDVKRRGVFHAHTLIKAARELMRGTMPLRDVLECAISWRKAEAHAIRDLPAAYRDEFKRLVSSKLVGLEAGRAAERLAYSKLVSSDGEYLEQILLASEVSVSPEEAISLIENARLEAEQILKLHWPAVLELAEILSTTKIVTKESADSLVDSLIQKHQLGFAC